MTHMHFLINMKNVHIKHVNMQLLHISHVSMNCDTF